MAELIVLTGPAADRRLEIGSEGRLVIGRDEGCNLVLDDSKVSRRHAYLQELDGGVEVGDLGSSNGTFVNGRRIERPVTLAPGDSLRIGTSSMRIEAAAGAGAGTEPAAAAPASDDRSRIRRMVSGDSSVIRRLRLERSVRRATASRRHRRAGRSRRCRRRRDGGFLVQPRTGAGRADDERDHRPGPARDGADHHPRRRAQRGLGDGLGLRGRPRAGRRRTPTSSATRACRG